MSSSQFSRWCAVLLLVGCNAKLQVDPGASAGNGGADERDGAGAPGAGRGPIGVNAGDGPGGGGPTVGGASGSAGAVIGPVPGQHGQPCIPGSTAVEADGSPAKTSITTLDRCDNGLACDATRHCTAMPACPQTSGPCVVHGVPLEDSGAGGTSANGGATGVSLGGADGFDPVSAEVGVTAMAADDTHLYWLDYGTRDALGNYQHDGALFAYSIADAKLSTLATDLPGPNALGITSGHAYVAVDGGPLIGSAPHAQLLRLPLTGGASELVQDGGVAGGAGGFPGEAFAAGAAGAGGTPGSSAAGGAGGTLGAAGDTRGTPAAATAKVFASIGDQAFWGTRKPGLYTVLPTPGAVVSTVDGSAYVARLAADASSVYYDNFTSMLSVPQAGNASSVVVTPSYTFALAGDSVYGIEIQGNPAGMILDGVPKTGGAWTRKGPLGAGGYADRLQIFGDRYVFSASPPFDNGTDPSREYLETGSISSAGPPVRLVEATGNFDGFTRMLWVATAQTVFWTDRSAIFSRSLTGK